jgi:signal peptidase I
VGAQIRSVISGEPGASATGGPASTADAGARASSSLHREATDFLVMSVCLVFLFRTFVAEPFGVPTGSMGATLLGRHKVCVCPECGKPIAVSASEEIDLESGRRKMQLTRGQCDNCQTDLDLSGEPARDGDRIFILKSPLDGFRPFDLAVFKFVDSPRLFYVKRLLGMPGETLRIHRGEVEVLDAATGEWRIRRKPASTIVETAVPVYDDRYRPAHRPARWTAGPEAEWRTTRRGYELTRGPENGPAKLEYRHLSPAGKPRLITDDLAFNSGLAAHETAESTTRAPWIGHPVRDLMVEASFHPSTQTKGFGAGLRAGPVRVAWFACPEGDAERHVVRQNGLNIASFLTDSSFTAGRSARFRFANVDKQVLLWKDGRLLGAWPYEAAEPSDWRKAFPTLDDLQPAILLADGAGTEIRDVVLLRDVYYTHQSQALDYSPPPRADESFLEQDKMWRCIKTAAPSRTWTLGAGQYFALGDNSSRSRDSRHWRASPFVEEQMLIGRAVLRIWPPEALHLFGAAR